MQPKKSVLTQTDVNVVKKRFLGINRERLLRAQQTLRDRQRDFLDLLPLLFHINHASLPGFVSKDTPAGISEYRPSDRSLAAAKRFAKAFSTKRRALLKYDLLSLYLMGSSGTVAYSKKSDFDVWICHTKDVEPARLEELRQKGVLIEQWAATLDLEVHFFLVEPESFSQGIHEDMSAESSGSAQHTLLMEEFYRTGLILAGRYPAWWLVPPDEEENYETIVAELRAKRFVLEGETIDFGPMHGVPAEEFFGAALWQLYKGIDSPYKSVLKLLMMEIYAAEYPKVELLCHRFKKAIYAGEISLDQLDPYIMLYKKIEDYLVSRGEDERLELVRRCFYFKVNEPLSVPERVRDENWRRDLMKQTTESWAWSSAYLLMLDARLKWKIERVVKERAVLVKALTFSYQFLSDFAREHAQLAHINQRDLNILGRKLYAAFERKAGKVEIINRGISQDTWESHLTFYRVTDGSNAETWLLYTAPLNVTEARRERPIRRSHSLIELLAWCHFNNMLDQNTVLAMHSQDSNITPRELKEMLVSFQKLFPSEVVFKTTIEDFASGAQAQQAAVYVNLGVDPMLEYTKQGKHLMSNKSDALSYGGLGENLAVSFDMITLTSWKEVLTSRYTGVSGLMECLRDCLRWVPLSSDGTLPPVSAQCFSYGRGLTIRQRIEELFNDVVKVFYGTPHGEATRYVLSIEQVFYVLTLENGVLSYEKAGHLSSLLLRLAMGSSTFSPIVADRYALTDTPLPTIFPVNKPGIVQVFYRAVDSYTEVFVLDERGSLFNQRMVQVDRNLVIGHFERFFGSILNRRFFELAGDNDAAEREVKGVEFIEIVYRDTTRPPYLIKREIMPRRRVIGMLDIQVIGHLGNEQASFTIYCDDKEFSSIEYGREMFREAARYVLSHRRSGENYPIYITDMDLPHAILGDDGTGHVQTIHFLNYKKRIEHQLNEAMAQLLKSTP